MVTSWRPSSNGATARDILVYDEPVLKNVLGRGHLHPVDVVAPRIRSVTLNESHPEARRPLPPSSTVRRASRPRTLVNSFATEGRALLYIQKLYILRLCWTALKASIGIRTMSAMLTGMVWTPRKWRKRLTGLTRSSPQKTCPARNDGSFSVHPRQDATWSLCSRFGMNACGLLRLIP